MGDINKGSVCLFSCALWGLIKAFHTLSNGSKVIRSRYLPWQFSALEWYFYGVSSPCLLTWSLAVAFRHLSDHGSDHL